MDLTCSRHDVAEKLLVGIKQQSLTQLIYYEKKVESVLATNSTNINKTVILNRMEYHIGY